MAIVAAPVISLKRALLLEDIKIILTLSFDIVERLPSAIKFPASVCVMSVCKPVRIILAWPSTILTLNAGVGVAGEGVVSSQNAFEQRSSALSANERIKSCDIFVVGLRLFFFDVFVLELFINSNVHATSKYEL